MSSFFALLFVVATLVLVVGVARKIIQYARTPAPLKIPTTPAPVNQAGVVLRLFREVVFFESLFKSTKWTWIFGWMFHLGLFVVLLMLAGLVALLGQTPAAAAEDEPEPAAQAS